MLLLLNGITTHDAARQIIALLGNNAFMRGGPIFFVLILVWFGKPGARHQVKMLTGLLVSLAAVIISISTQFLFTPHVRPFMNRAIGIKENIGPMQLHRLGSFPSDTAALYFALCMIIFLERKWAGIACALWATLTIGLCRVALGYHYPSDVLGGAALGGGLVLLAVKFRPLQEWLVKSFIRLNIPANLSTAFMFVLMADAYGQFFGIMGVIHMLRVLGAGLVAAVGRA
jgi:undecaprenyl-diphosphatase